MIDPELVRLLGLSHDGLRGSLGASEPTMALARAALARGTETPEMDDGQTVGEQLGVGGPVRWVLDLSDHAPVVGDLLVRPLTAGEAAWPGWNEWDEHPGIGDGGFRVAWKVATADDTTVTGVLVVPPRDLSAGTAVATSSGAPSGVPVVSAQNGQPFGCPFCGERGHRAGSAPGGARFSPPEGHETAATYTAQPVPGTDRQQAEAVLLCLADRVAGRRRWRLLLPD